MIGVTSAGEGRLTYRYSQLHSLGVFLLFVYLSRMEDTEPHAAGGPDLGSAPGRDTSFIHVVPGINLPTHFAAKREFSTKSSRHDVVMNAQSKNSNDDTQAHIDGFNIFLFHQWDRNCIVGQSSYLYAAGLRKGNHDPTRPDPRRQGFAGR